MSKRWIRCISCDFQADCLVCKSRLDDYDKKSTASEDVGCYNHEMIKNQRKREQEKMQLKLFKI